MSSKTAAKHQPFKGNLYDNLKKKPNPGPDTSMKHPKSFEGTLHNAVKNKKEPGSDPSYGSVNKYPAQFRPTIYESLKIYPSVPRPQRPEKEKPEKVKKPETTPTKPPAPEPARKPHIVPVAPPPAAPVARTPEKTMASPAISKHNFSTVGSVSRTLALFN